ncbi:MAG: hypothetical protein ACP5F1_01400 [Thermoplasmata archaeon]|nr:S26 family signal peptidase [Thermoplasmata archaeon]
MKESSSLDTIKSIIIAISVILIIFAGLYLYAGNWPPVTIIESSSMQHGDHFTWGVINTGDIVIQKKVTNISQIITYVQGRESGYTSYGDYGNVILYQPYPGATPVIHRAIFYITWQGLSFHIKGETLAIKQGWMVIKGYDVIIKNVGFSHRNLVVNVSSSNPYSGFMDLIGKNGFFTMGDNNLANSPFSDENVIFPSIAYYACDQNVGIASGPVSFSQIVGVAQGWLPWFGIIKLVLSGDTQYIPTDSYYYLGITLTLIVIIAFLWDYLPERKKK